LTFFIYNSLISLDKEEKMKTEFEKSLRKVRGQLKRAIDEKQKNILRQELKHLKAMMRKEKLSS
jgi:hypothetical protein